MPKKKALKTINPLDGAMQTMRAMAGYCKQDRQTALRDTLGKVTIDTCCAFDTGTWETGIQL